MFICRKQCITSETTFDFLKEVVEKVPDVEQEKVEKRGRPRKGLGSSTSSLKEGEEEEEEEEEEAAPAANGEQRGREEERSAVPA